MKRPPYEVPRGGFDVTALKGILGYLVTPFGESGHGIDADILRITVDRMIEGGVDGVAPLGSTGESAYLTDDEWREVVEANRGSILI